MKFVAVDEAALVTIQAVSLAAIVASLIELVKEDMVVVAVQTWSEVNKSEEVAVTLLSRLCLKLKVIVCPLVGL